MSNQQIVGLAIIPGIAGAFMALLAIIHLIPLPNSGDLNDRFRRFTTGLVFGFIAVVLIILAIAMVKSTKTRKNPSATPELISQSTDGCATYRAFIQDRYKYFVKCGNQQPIQLR